MYVKTIEYTDFNGVERKEDFYFNLSKSEILKLETSLDGGLTSYLDLMVQKQSQSNIMSSFEKIVDAAYGVKSLDGRTFMKTPEALAEFKATNAYDKFFMDLALNEEAAAEFLIGIMPNDTAKVVQKAVDAGVVDGASLNDAQKEALQKAMGSIAGTVSAVDSAEQPTETSSDKTE